MTTEYCHVLRPTSIACEFIHSPNFWCDKHRLGRNGGATIARARRPQAPSRPQHIGCTGPCLTLGGTVALEERNAGGNRKILQVAELNGFQLEAEQAVLLGQVKVRPAEFLKGPDNFPGKCSPPAHL